MSESIKINIENHIEPKIIEALLESIIQESVSLVDIIDMRLERITGLCATYSQLIGEANINRQSDLSANETTAAFELIESETKIVQSLLFGLTEKAQGGKS